MSDDHVRRSSVLVPIYVPEQFSGTARAVVRAAGQLPFTALHQLEVPNAFAVARQGEA